MRTGKFITAILVILVLGKAQAAVATFEAKGEEYVLDTGQSGGVCRVVDRGAAGVDVDCSDRATGRRAFGNSRTGCLAVERGGLCYHGKPPSMKSGIMVECGSTKYLLGAASEQISCQVTYDVSEHAVNASCDDHKDTRSRIDCSKDNGQGACDYTTGSSDCQIVSP